MIRRTVLFVVAALIVGGAIWLLGPGSRPSGEKVPAVSQGPGVEGVETTIVEPTPTGVPGAPRALAIRGQCFDDRGLGVPGLTLVCGEETATTDELGRFLFPAAVRLRSTELRVLRGGQAAAVWPSVLTRDGPDDGPAAGAAGAGDAEGAAGAAADPGWLPARLERIRWSLNDLGGSSRGRAGWEWIQPRQLLCEDWGDRVRVRVRGDTRLPDGAILTLTLNFDGSRILSSVDPARCRGGAFEGELISPPEFRLASGTYELEVAYSVVVQDPNLAFSEWPRTRPEVEWPALQIPEVLVPIYLGEAREAEDEDCAVAGYYRQAIDEARRLERALKTRVEEILDLAYGVDPATLRKLLDESRYPELAAARKEWDPRLLEARSATRLLGNSDLVRGGVLQEARWREFLDVEWRPALLALEDRHASRAAEKYPEAAAKLGAVFRDLLAEGCLLSRFLVYPPGSPGHPNDFCPDEDELGDLSWREGLIRSNLEGLERYRNLCRSRP